MLRESGLSQLKIPKPVCDMQNRNVGMRTRAPRGMHPASQLGSRAKCFRKKSNRCLRMLQPPLFDHGLAFPVGTQAGFARAIDRMHDTGKHWRNSLAFRRMCKVDHVLRAIRLKWAKKN